MGVAQKRPGSLRRPAPDRFRRRATCVAPGIIVQKNNGTRRETRQRDREREQTIIQEDMRRYEGAVELEIQRVGIKKEGGKAKQRRSDTASTL